MEVDDGVKFLWSRDIFSLFTDSLIRTILQVPVVQKLNSVINRISHYPVDK